MNHAIEQIPAAASRMAQLREGSGRPGTVEITLGAAGIGPDDLRRFADAGVGRVLVKPWTSSKDAIEGIRRFADEDLPVVRDHPVAPPGRP
jgi:methylmalonyl-CoA mutase cobalamin-binding subunit